jgi:hypothetical protein
MPRDSSSWSSPKCTLCLFPNAPAPYSGILESAARSAAFADVGEEDRTKYAEGGEEDGVVAGEEVAELEREGGELEEVEDRRRKGKESEGRR